jgi:glycosyltransferase involved in cell wall biosynthesis
MNPAQTPLVCLTPRLSGVGGMVSFQQKLAAGLQNRGIEVCYDPADTQARALLVVGGTRHLRPLLQARRRGIPVIQRLDGMNWIHRVQARRGSGRLDVRHYLRAEYGNLILALIRRRIASRIVYQSEFSRRWWERVHGPTPVEHTVIYNGVNLDDFTPQGTETPPDDRCRLLLVEGSLMGGYELGLETAVQLARRLAALLAKGDQAAMPVELLVAGRVSEALQKSWEERLAQAGAPFTLHWAGVVPHEKIPALDRSAHLLYSADVNAACPNSVVEALACGLPVVAFDTGALPEMVAGDAGRIAAYGGDPWRLDPPDVDALVHAALEILENQPRFRAAARQRAEEAFDLETMVARYAEVLLG